eukprot:TRINITY_DN925_c7_g1_i1.p1 TRINITY_DN925_c7_g1~~TRINITY_DN925_c7_g1_i1.p1  ORF type:complete len:196 (+),score=26.66 TRINITY_DN925_c7_g1_i1:71-589(+)
MGDDYTLMVLALPVYWFLLMIPVAMRQFRIFHPSEPSIKGNGLSDPLTGTTVPGAPNPVTFNQNPRGAIAKIIEDVDNPDSAYIRRAQAAHDNGWEGFILFISAVTAVSLANADPQFCNTCSAIILIGRFFYNIAYAVGTTPATSFLRSATFAFQFFALSAMWIKAIYDVVN